MILHTVGYPGVKLCNFVCEGTSGGAQARRAAKFQNLPANFVFLLINGHVYTLCIMYLPKVQEGGFYFFWVFVFMFCAICN